MRLTSKYWGKVQQQPIDVQLFTLENKNGMTLSVTNYGCIVTSIRTPDRDNKMNEVVLGYDNLEQYLNGHPFFGAIAGRYANRIHNGRYTLDGIIHQLEINELATSQHLHGGLQGFDKYVWSYAIEEKNNSIFIHFSRISPDKESGYCGNLNVTHTIGLDEQNQVYYCFKAVTDKPTILNLVNHSYYNLAGADSGSINDHELTLYADFYTPVSDTQIPTGEVLSVRGTGLDFTSPTVIKKNCTLISEEGFDHNYVLHRREKEGNYALAAKLHEPISGRTMTVLTTQPAVQFYNGFKLSNRAWYDRKGIRYGSCAGLCLETQHFPDSPNHAHFPTTRLDPGEVYAEKTIHRFGVE